MTLPKRRYFLGLILVCGLAILCVGQTTLASPPLSPTVPLQPTVPPPLPPALPSRFYGTVSLNGNDVPAGTMVGVGHDGIIYLESEVFDREGVSRYVLNVPEDDPETPERDGGSSGETLEFWIGDVLADQQATWVSGGNEELNLMATVLFKLYLPLVMK